MNYIPVPTNTQLTSNLTSYHRRQAFVMYLQNNPGGITLYGWTVDRSLINTIFFIELSLVLFVLGRTTLLESGLKVKEYELLRLNFSDTLTPAALVLVFRSTSILVSNGARDGGLQEVEIVVRLPCALGVINRAIGHATAMLTDFEGTGKS
ncbi:hypothetical protein CTI12_AA442290 [Artemisia annua]|uniref:Uncharacterized protein n=1 Tax=Artemisia annua TaxID=35608 RepID=A0A2U1LXJ7_ARTAN|nr:hypothetical protein CTI12_AA442290 [Artemisia annua]